MSQVVFNHSQTITAREVIRLNLLEGLSIASRLLRKAKNAKSYTTQRFGTLSINHSI